MFLNRLSSHCSVLYKTVLTLVLIVFSSAATAQINLVFGVYTSDQPTAMVKAYRPILSALETRLSDELNRPVKIKLQVASTFEQGITAQSLESFDYLDRHDRVAHAVAKGTHDAGALKEGTFRKLNKKGLNLRALVTIPLVNRPWVASASLDRKILNALRLSMLDLNAPAAFKALGRKQFVEGSEADFARIRTAIKNNKRFFTNSVAPLVINEE